MTVLDKIIADTRTAIAARRSQTDDAGLEAQLGARPEGRPFAEALVGDGVSVIAEHKRRSPSAGPIREGASLAAIITAYENGGAAALSIITEEAHFGGSLDDLRAVRAAVDVPVLRKDFIVTPYQLVEARAAGADLALLIVAALDDEELTRLFHEAGELGLTTLVEVHDEQETERAVALGAELIGVNARNLKTLEVDTDTFGRLAPRVPDDRVLVAESGITGPTDVERFVAEGARVVLVGEALVRDGAPREAVAAMTGITA